MSASPDPATSTQFTGHVLTDEERRRGGQRSGEVRRERGKSVRERFADIAQERAEAIAEVFLEAMESDDKHLRVKAATSFLAECFGRPSQAITGADGGPIEVQHTDVAVAREEFLKTVDELAERRQLKTGTDG